MQRYWITDGKNYVKLSKGKYQKTNSPTMASSFAYNNAQRILQNNLPSAWRKVFYLEGVQDGTKITIEDLAEIKEKKTHDKQTEMLNEFTDSVLSFMDSLNKIPSQAQCVAKKKVLDNLQSDIDSQISDIYHWIEVNNPPVSVRCVVFSTLQEKLKMRRIIKQSENYIDGLIECYEKKKSIDQVIDEMHKRKFDTYRARTEIYDELTKIYKGYANGYTKKVK